MTDHAEYIGEMYSTFTEGAPGHDQELLEQLRNLSTIRERQEWFLKYVQGPNRGTDPRHPEFYAGIETTRSAWRKVIVAAAEQNNEPGRFTAFIAFEWSGAPGGANLHRNVIFRDNNVPDVPLSYYDTGREDGIWDWMEQQESKGMQLLAVPHNSNASKGVMYAESIDAAGAPYDTDYANRRAHYEPLVEVMQIKGNSEVHRNFWQADEFANFENADSMAKYSGRTLDERNYVRWAMIEGLNWENKLGANPFRQGFVGGTDNHNGLPGETMEAGSYGTGWQGAHGQEDGSVERRRNNDVGGWIDSKDENPGALTGVWATANTRAYLFDAMKSRETFATSGTRIKPRFFCGFGLSPKSSDPQSLVADGYANGVPMGGVLAKTEGRMTCNVQASKDPDGANLDRIQIIKGWVDPDGLHHEKIINVAWSGERSPDADGLLPPVGNTVDLKTSKYTNDIGSPVLIGSWTDEDFDPDRNALYYARVLEIPTPRWTTYDAVLNGLPLLEDVPPVIQERAWTSPIWYVP